ncbi:MAG: adenosylcobinamide-GDP ribazoletransferase [Candidatus Nanopelagicales bacterium]
MHSSLPTGFRLATGTLTIIPVGSLPAISKREAAWAMSLAPIAVLPLAVLSAAITAAAHALRLPGEVTAGLILAVLAWGTRAMHWDGLTDTADGFAAGWDRERALQVMRLGNVGPVGVGSLVVVILLDVFALAAIESRPNGWVAVGALVVVSRAALAMAASVRMPAARDEGLGAVVAGSVPLGVTFVVMLLALAFMMFTGHLAGLGEVHVLLATTCGFAAVLFLLRVARRIVGGVTGDVLGAAIELLFCVLAVTLSAGIAS